MERARDVLRASRGLVTVRDGSTAVVGRIGLAMNAACLSSGDGAEDHAFRLALEYAMDSERSGPSSALTCVIYALRLAARCPLVELPSPRAFVRDDVRSLLGGLLDDRDMEIAVQLIERSGSGGLVVDSRPSRRDCVETIDGYEFVHSSIPVEPSVVLDGALILAADGYVERVSEIHGLLDSCSRSSERLLLCCRGASDDVLHTVAINRVRGTLNAWILIFPHDERDANTLVDIAVVSGGDVVSSLKGQLFSTVTLSSLSRVERAVIRGSILEIDNAHTAHSTAKLAEDLRRRASETSVDFVASLLNDRVRRLRSFVHVVHLANGLEHASRREAWDVALRSSRAATHGVIDVNDTEAWPRRTLVPAVSEATARKYAHALVGSLVGSVSEMLRSRDRYQEPSRSLVSAS